MKVIEKRYIKTKENNWSVPEFVTPTQVCVSEPGTPTPAPLGSLGVRILFGQPCIMSFDHQRVDFYAQGEYWIAKSEQVHLQARYRRTNVTSGLSVTKEFVFSVSFVKCNVVCLSAMATSWNGQAMIPTFPSNLSNDLVFYARGEYWIARSEEVDIQACYRPRAT